ncbi:class II aldolase/adducin family protein [Pseudomonas syringae]|uniref:class II aldolase/adducin family protein n=1 Tax=Pseudomonas syringae TaxID=317 RepID=UPI000405B8CB|nr:class II aldolase/adducin family protein [Pseudomonas syringae]KTB81578.1 fuculose phosphate aldolase [Pseudomonas syringae pv. syringae PD2766]MCF5466505.1 class II aldolase/adducin family protein [Pseudomonas syringae]MCF5471402.1 class II aldolase/adducin family protein [Pseudomonas syringae]MCF5482303.1 class II aldolase/adducin family protein [Pseudomonas syringae]MCF5486185.1 class II aldolase/adducin family protein [Pseudomonas syringae]
MSSVQQQIVALSRHLSRRGFFAATGGNLALRIDAQHIAVTPSATDYFSMRAEDVCVLRLVDLKQLSGARSPSVESELHARVLRCRPDVNCSIHTHQPLASACTLFGKPLEVPYPPLWASLGKRIPLVGYAPSGSGWLAGKLEKAIRPDHNAYLMRNHGVLCCGPDIETTLARLEDLEKFCRDHLVNQIKANASSRPEASAAAARLIKALSSPHALSPQTFSETYP